MPLKSSFVRLAFLLLLLLSAAPQKSHASQKRISVLFGGGGIRAQFGSLIAGCELSKLFKHRPRESWPFLIEDFVGLSGGAWGAVTLSNAHSRGPYARASPGTLRGSVGEGWDPDADPCLELDRVKGLQSWGRTDPYVDLLCQKDNRNVAKTCYGGWKRLIHEEIFNSVPPRDLYTRGSAFGSSTKHKIIFSTCEWKRPKWKVFPTTFHDGVCSVWNTPSPVVKCAEFGVNGRTYQWNLHQAKIIDISNQPQSLTMVDALAMSSYAMAEMTKVPFFPALIPFRPSLSVSISPPNVTLPQPVLGNKRSFRTCDHGGICNMPLAYLRTLAVSEIQKLDALLVFDFTDFANADGKTVRELEICADVWKKRFGWEVLRPHKQDWGFTFKLKLAKNQNRLEILVQVVTFQGLKSKEDLVKKFPTMDKITVNWFDPKEISLILGEYAPFLEQHLHTGSKLLDFNPNYRGKSALSLERNPTPIPDRYYDSLIRMGFTIPRIERILNIPNPLKLLRFDRSQLEILQNQDPKSPQPQNRRLDRDAVMFRHPVKRLQQHSKSEMQEDEMMNAF